MFMNGISKIVYLKIERFFVFPLFFLFFYLRLIVVQYEEIIIACVIKIIYINVSMC